VFILSSKQHKQTPNSTPEAAEEQETNSSSPDYSTHIEQANCVPCMMTAMKYRSSYRARALGFTTGEISMAKSTSIKFQQSVHHDIKQTWLFKQYYAAAHGHLAHHSLGGLVRCCSDDDPLSSSSNKHHIKSYMCTAE
jgi:hypothetical protein